MLFWKLHTTCKREVYNKMIFLKIIIDTWFFLNDDSDDSALLWENVTELLTILILANLNSQLQNIEPLTIFQNHEILNTTLHCDLSFWVPFINLVYANMHLTMLYPLKCHLDAT